MAIEAFRIFPYPWNIYIYMAPTNLNWAVDFQIQIAKMSDLENI